MRQIGRPEPGYFRVRLVAGGPWVPARIYYPCPIDPDFGEPMDRGRYLAADIDGLATAPMEVWISGRPITVAEWQYLTDTARWARHHAPHDPAARPRQRIDLNALPAIF